MKCDKEAAGNFGCFLLPLLGGSDIKSLYNLNTGSETLIQSLKAIIYNKMRYEDSTVKSIDKEF